MPGIVRKLLVLAAVDGVVLQPLAQKGQRPAPPTKITYGDNLIGPVLKHGTNGDEAGKSFEAFGVVGKGFDGLMEGLWLICGPYLLVDPAFVPTVCKI